MSFEIIKKRLDEYISLQSILKASPEKICRRGFVTIYLGDDYFVELKPDQAVSFLDRRIGVLQNEVDTIQHLTGINDEGLPIMDIFEELDEDDNIISSRVDRAASAFEHLQKAMEETAKTKQPETPAQLDIKKMEKPEPEEPRVKEVEEPEEQKTFNGISKDDLLELHLVQDELDFDDDDDMEIDLDELEIDDDEDSDESSTGYTEPLHGSLFPQTQRVRELLAKQFPDLNEDRKAVRFAESLEVREFETSPDERKGLVVDEIQKEPVKEEPKRRGVSQFKLRRGGSQSLASPAGATSSDPSVERSTSNQPDEMSISQKPISEHIVERPASTVVSRVCEVVERPVSEVAERNLEAVEKPVSKAVERVSTVVESPLSQIKERPVKDISVPNPPKAKSVYSRRYKVPESRPAPVPLAAPKIPQPDPAYEGLGYIRDEDTVARKELEDEALKLFDQSTIPDEDFLAMHGDALEEEPDQEKNDKPILSEVSERDHFEPVDSDEIEKFKDMHEIRLKYQRLRQRLVHKAGGYGKTEKDMETEVIDEDGNLQKVSRFKSARIGMR